MRARRPRLNPALYVGLQRYFLTFCTCNRAPYFTSAAAVDMVREKILQTADAWSFELIAYCFMPDHAHLLAVGQTEDADATAWIHQAKQQSGFWFKKKFNRALWQPSYYDRVLRDEDATLAVIRYTFENPVRAGLVKHPSEYPYLGSTYPIDEVMEAIRWQP